MHNNKATSLHDLAILAYIQRCVSMQVYEHVRYGEGWRWGVGGFFCFVRLSKVCQFSAFTTASLLSWQNVELIHVRDQV